MLADHDRIDKKLHVAEYTDFPCGSLNLKTQQAEYCGYDCPTLKARMMSGEDPGKATNRAEGLYYRPFDPATEMTE